jgi:hypothetical protein
MVLKARASLAAMLPTVCGERKKSFRPRVLAKVKKCGELRSSYAPLTVYHFVYHESRQGPLEGDNWHFEQKRNPLI